MAQCTHIETAELRRFLYYWGTDNWPCKWPEYDR